MFLYSYSKNFRVENFPSIEYPLPVDNDAGATVVSTCATTCSTIDDKNSNNFVLLFFDF